MNKPYFDDIFHNGFKNKTKSNYMVLVSNLTYENAESIRISFDFNNKRF